MALVLKGYYRPDEVAEFIRVSKRTIYRMIAEGQLGVVKLRTASSWRVPRGAIVELVGEINWQDGTRYLKPSEVAGILNVSRSSIYRWFWEGKLKGFKISKGTLRFPVSAVEEFMAGQPEDME